MYTMDNSNWKDMRLCSQCLAFHDQQKYKKIWLIYKYANCIIVHSTCSSALTVECIPRSGPKIQQRSLANIVNTMHTQMYTTTEPDVRATFFANYYVNLKVCNVHDTWLSSPRRYIMLILFEKASKSKMCYSMEDQVAWKFIS